MDILFSVVNATVQGLTEFLPVSSSGHLVLASSLYKIITGQAFNVGGQQEIFLDIMLHLGTLIAVLAYFKNDLIQIISGSITAIKTKTLKTNKDSKMVFNVMIATLATIAVVLPLKDWFESSMNKPAEVGIQIAITGILLFAAEIIADRRAKKTPLLKNESEINWKNAIWIGIAQGIAVSPGISRSGSTILAGLASGFDRVTCARFSFIMSIPIIILGAVSEVLDVGLSSLKTFNWPAIAIGTVLSGIIGYYCIKYFILYLSKYSLKIFGYYCLTVGLLMYAGFTFIR